MKVQEDDMEVQEEAV